MVRTAHFPGPYGRALPKAGHESCPSRVSRQDARAPPEPRSRRGDGQWCRHHHRRRYLRAAWRRDGARRCHGVAGLRPRGCAERPDRAQLRRARLDVPQRGRGVRIHPPGAAGMDRVRRRLGHGRGTGRGCRDGLTRLRALRGIFLRPRHPSGGARTHRGTGPPRDDRHQAVRAGDGGAKRRPGRGPGDRDRDRRAPRRRCESPHRARSRRTAERRGARVFRVHRLRRGHHAGRRDARPDPDGAQGAAARPGHLDRAVYRRGDGRGERARSRRSRRLSTPPHGCDGPRPGGAEAPPSSRRSPCSRPRIRPCSP